MKVVFLVLAPFLFSGLAHANNICARAAEKQTPGPGYISQAQFLQHTVEGNLVYAVRVEYQGGTAAHWLTFTPGCKLISRRLAWSD